MDYSATPTLTGEHIILRQLSIDDEAELQTACADGELWKLWYATIPRPEGVGELIRDHLRAQSAGERAPWAVVDKRSSRVIGVTTYLNIVQEHKRLDVGYTWIAGSFQGTSVNVEAKYLLLSRAFEELGVNRVELRTHFYNRRSRAAIEKLGAKLDGILRKHTILPNGTTRDTCVYSLIDDDWPTAKVSLRYRLGLL